MLFNLPDFSVIQSLSCGGNPIFGLKRQMLPGYCLNQTVNSNVLAQDVSSSKWNPISRKSRLTTLVKRSREGCSNTHANGLINPELMTSPKRISSRTIKTVTSGETDINRHPYIIPNSIRKTQFANGNLMREIIKTVKSKQIK